LGAHDIGEVVRRNFRGGHISSRDELFVVCDTTTVIARSEATKQSSFLVARAKGSWIASFRSQ
jgi:hypothetical protein